MKAVIDRIENGIAILLVDRDEQRVELPIELLPEGATEGSWLKICPADEDSDSMWQNASMVLDLEGELKQREKVSGLLERLKNKQKK